MTKVIEKTPEVPFQKTESSWKNKLCLGGLTLTLVGLIITAGLEWKDIAASYENNPLAWQIGLGVSGGIALTSLAVFIILKRRALKLSVSSSSSSKTAVISKDTQDGKATEKRTYHYYCICPEDLIPIAKIFMERIKINSTNGLSYEFLPYPYLDLQTFQWKNLSVIQAKKSDRVVVFYQPGSPRQDWGAFDDFVENCFSGIQLNPKSKAGILFTWPHSGTSKGMQFQPKEVETIELLKSKHIFTQTIEGGIRKTPFDMSFGGEENLLNPKALETYVNWNNEPFVDSGL